MDRYGQKFETDHYGDELSQIEDRDETVRTKG